MYLRGKMNYKYHPRILNVFSMKELDKIMKNYSVYCVDDDGRVDYILLLTDKLYAEISTDDLECQESALIINLNHDDDEFIMNKNKFWDIFITSKTKPLTTITVD